MSYGKLKIRRGRQAAIVEAERRERMRLADIRPTSLDGRALTVVQTCMADGGWWRRRTLVDLITDRGVPKARAEFLVNDLVRLGAFHIRTVATGRPGRPPTELKSKLTDMSGIWR